jgi:uncharacterized protein
VQVFWDSDVGKWIEAAAYALAHRRDEVIEAQIEAIIDDLAAAQAPDGYLNCWYLCREPENRWTNLRDNHELYNAGHLLEGAVAYFQTTGRRRLLDIMERYLDHIRSQFGTEPGKRRGYCGHPEIEMALVKLYRVTGDPKALALASYFVDERGASPQYFDEEAKARGADPRRLHPENPRIFAIAPARPPADQGGRPCRPGDVPLFRYGRSGGPSERQDAANSLRDFVE